jgi:hypothetical protein
VVPRGGAAAQASQSPSLPSALQGAAPARSSGSTCPPNSFPSSSSSAAAAGECSGVGSPAAVRVGPGG